MTIEPQSPGAQSSPSPPSVSPGQPQPFSDEPQEAPGGCGRPLLVGCGIAVVLLGLLLLGFLWKARDFMPAMFRWSLEQFEQQVTANLPEDLGEAERQRLADAFDAAATAVENGTADAAALQRLQGQLLAVARAGNLTRDRVIDLIEALESVAGERAPPASPEPAPEGGGDSMPLALLGPSPQPALAA